MGLLHRKTIIFQGSNIFRWGGSNIYRGVQLFPGGVQMLIFMKAHITCDFPGGIQTPYPPPPPLDPHMTQKN